MKTWFRFILTAALFALLLAGCDKNSRIDPDKIKRDKKQVESVTVEPGALTLNVGEKRQLSIKVEPEDADYQNVIWACDNRQVATVSDNGEVSAFVPGTATITAKAGTKVGWCNLTVVGIPVTSVTVSPSTLTLVPWEETTLTATVLPENATDKSIVWESTDRDIVVVEGDTGWVHANGSGKATIIARSSNGIVGTCEVTVLYTQPEAVDIGLSVKWASLNLGAIQKERGGYYFAWGETEPRKIFSWSNYKWGNSYTNITKYNSDPSYGVVDRKRQLEMADDAARVHLGGKWRLPTEGEVKELLNTQYDSDQYSWSNYGHCVTIYSKKTKQRLYFPLQGFATEDDIVGRNEMERIWSATPDGFEAVGLSIYSDPSANVNKGSRYLGYGIRPVCDK